MPDPEVISPMELFPPAAAEFRLSGLARWWFLFTGVILPVICFVLGYPEKPDWQSGEAVAYAELFLSHKGSLPFYPLLFYCIASMGLVVYRPQRFVRNALLRFGIYSGVVVSIGFFAVFSMTFSHAFNSRFWESYLFWAVLCTIVFGVILFFGSKSDTVAALSYLLIFLCIGAFPISIGFSLFFATPWAVASYATMSFFILRHRRKKGFQFSLAQLLGAVTWFGGYCAAWKVAYLNVLEEYAKLPTASPPGCYLCTAAARGHRRFVRSEECMAADGRKFRVNDQLRCLKAFEFLLLAVCPRLHWLCRRIYDRVGPELARTVEYPLLADAVYAVLKPLEWICRARFLRWCGIEKNT